MDRRSQRFLLALTSVSEDEDEYSEKFTFEGILAAIIGVLCLVYVALMCLCKDSKQKETSEVDLQRISVDTEKQSLVKVTSSGANGNSKTEEEPVPDGAVQVSVPLPGHLTSLVTANVRKSGVRVLPAPPVPNYSSQNNLISASGQSEGNDDEETDYDFVEQTEKTHNSKIPASSSSSDGKNKVKTNSHIYDHLGHKPSAIPSDYDSFSKLRNPGAKTIKSVPDEESDNDYSEVEETTYPEVIDVKTKKTELSVTHSKTAGKDDVSLDYYSQMKDDDPYNRIWDSGGIVPSSLVSQLKQSSEQDDPYATVQGDSAGDIKSILGAEGEVGGTVLHKITPVSHYFPNTSSTSRSEGANEEYAVVQKKNRVLKHPAENGVDASKEYTVSPAGPQNLPSIEENSAVKNRKKHNYSRVTARESLASMSARKSHNPYDIVADGSDGTYSMVDGGSEEGNVIDGATGGIEEKRLSQTSDTYAEIGISGASLSSTINISSSNPEHSNSNNSFTPISSAFNTTTNEYEDSAGCYVTLKQDSYQPSVSSGDSRAVTDLSINQSCDANGKAVDYSDYDSVDDMTAQVLPADAAANASGNKKIGQRRQKLDQN